MIANSFNNLLNVIVKKSWWRNYGRNVIGTVLIISAFLLGILESSKSSTEIIDQKQQNNGNSFWASYSFQPLLDKIRSPAANIVTYNIKVGKNDTLSSIFSRLNLSQQELHQALSSDPKAKKLLTNLNIGQPINIELKDGNLSRIFSKISPLESVELTRTTQGFKLDHQYATPHVEERYLRGIINDSLFATAKKIGLNDNIIIELSQIFAYNIDFSQDIRKGDEFEIVYEEKYHQGKKVGTGNILAARFTVSGANHTAILFKNPNGKMQYFDASGKGMRKQFLRNPIDFVRISSYFSLGRKHPILNKIRAHKGIDYAAKTGTPIRATADGQVVFKGERGGYGNAIILQHGSKYRTLYAHMSRFNSSIKKGSHVKQGQIIGYVGMTGLATGPHLHYEFQVNGVHINPLSRKLPTMDTTAVVNKKDFLKHSVSLINRMDSEKERMLARLK